MSSQPFCRLWFLNGPLLCSWVFPFPHHVGSYSFYIGWQMAFEFVGLQGQGCSLLVSQAPSECLSQENVWKSLSPVPLPARSWWMRNSALTWSPNSSLHPKEGPCHGIAKINCFVWAWCYHSSWGSPETMLIQNSERSISWALNKRPVSRAVLPPAN